MTDIDPRMLQSIVAFLAISIPIALSIVGVVNGSRKSAIEQTRTLERIEVTIEQIAKQLEMSERQFSELSDKSHRLELETTHNTDNIKSLFNVTDRHEQRLKSLEEKSR